mgnify:CR=1 FL=1
MAAKTRTQELAEALDNYTDPTHPEYDAEFDKQIRTLRPDWFTEHDGPHCERCGAPETPENPQAWAHADDGDTAWVCEECLPVAFDPVTVH